MIDGVNPKYFEVTDIIAVISVVVIFITWGVTHWYTRRKDRIAYSANLIANISNNPMLFEADHFMASAIKDRKSITDSVEQPIDPEDDRKVMVLLDYYEYLATMYLKGAVDKKIILHLRGDAMRQAFEVCKEYIAFRQETIGDYVYNDLQRFIAQCCIPEIVKSPEIEKN